MVGISGGSKGCRTCRRRRVKCDERQPSCDRCERGGFDCGGFGKDLNFINENSGAKRRSLKQESLRAKSIKIEKDSSNCDKRFILGVSGPVSTAPTKLWSGLSYIAFKNEIQISFTFAKLFSRDARSIAWLGWGYNTPEHTINSDALKALSHVYYGRIHHEPSLESDARMYYLKTVRGISRAIGSHGGTSVDVLLAAMTASCYEMIASPTHVRMLLHAGGIGGLIQLRGPEQHRGMFELHILSTMRTSICMKAMLDRKRCFLEQDEWKTIPWSIHSEEKTMSAWVQDILCDVPGLLEDYDALATPDITPKMYKFRFEGLKANINYHLRLLSDWRARWEEVYPGICYEQVPRHLKSPFPTVLYYRDLKAVNGLMLHNALYISISELGERLLGPDYDYRHVASGKEFECTNPLLNLPGVSLYDTAIEICRSIEYHLSPPYGSAGAFFIIFPLKKANDTLPSGSAEQEWVEDMITNLATKNGFLFSTGVLSQRVL